MKRIIILFILLHLTLKYYAQPGGGGGLLISNLYDQKFKTINILEDSFLQIRTFILIENKIYQETFLYQSYITAQGKMQIGRSHGFGFPPTSDIDNDEYLDRMSNQRMFIVYKKDTMIVDFMGIIGENGIGYSDAMDSLVVQKGYFKYYRCNKKNQPYDYNDFDKNRNLINNGLTFHTLELLTAAGYIEYFKQIDNSFLNEEQMPASFFFKRAKYFLMQNKTENAFEDIYKGIRKDGNEMNCESLFLLTDAFAKIEKYDSAIKYISKAINCKRYGWSENNLDNYRTRIQFFIKSGKYNLALNDYDTLISKAIYKITEHNEKALFLINVTKNNRAAIQELTSVINAIPDDDLNGCNPKLSEYAEVYFNLGLAEYSTGKEKSAFKNWLKAMEWGYCSSGSNEAEVHLDSMIQIHPKVPELYLARAIATQKRIPYLGGGEEANHASINSINDINNAERLGFKDFRINYYRAVAFHELKNYQKALDELQIAIRKQPDYPGSYLMRFKIREDAGQAKWGDQDDSDIVKYKMLCKSWRFER